MVSLLDRFNEWLNPKPKRTYVDLREKREQDAMKVHLLAKFGKMFALALMLTSPASAQMVGAQFRDFSAGLNDSASSLNLNPNESPDLVNVVIDEPVGSLKPRGGFLKCGVSLPSGSVATELYNWSRADGSQYLIVADNTNVYQTSDCNTYTRIATGQSATNKPNFATVRDKLWFVNGSTNPYTWDGATTTVLGGSAGTPAPVPPRGRYIEFWRERVWISRTSADPSAVQFSALTDTAGNDLDPSTGTLAWPAINQIYVDRDGGSPIYGIKAYRDNLYVFKGNGIWRIAFNNDFDIAVVKTLSSVGTRFGSSVVEKDNLLHFVGPDGIYSFDGDVSVRISDRINQRFLSLRQPLTAEGLKIWTSQSDFDDGTASSTTFTIESGSVLISTQSSLLENGNFESGSLSPWYCVDPDPTSGTCNVYSSTETIPNWGVAGAVEGNYSASLLSAGGLASSGRAAYSVIGVDGSTKTAEVFLDSPDDTGGFECQYASTKTIDASSYAGSSVRLKFRTAGPSETAELWSPAFQATGLIKFTYTARTQANWPTWGWNCLDLIRDDAYFSTGTWTSDTYQAVSLSSWSVFDANSRSNGGSIQYQVRVGSSALNVSTAVWSNITPGSLVPGATWQNFVQFRASFSATSDLQSTPALDDISVSFLKGGSQTQTIYGSKWRNRYWVSAASGTSDTNNLALVNSKYEKAYWIPYDLQIGPMVQYNDNFYAAASTHAAIYRLDYGTNDDGAAINWYWTSRDESFGQPLYRKRLLEIGTDFIKANAGSSISVGYSKDSGATFTNKTVNMSGTGRGVDRRLLDGGHSFDFRLRVGSTQLDAAPTLIGITGWSTIQPGRR